MKTPHEVLADETILRLHREEEEKKWTTLVSRCRTPRGQMPFLAQLIMSAVLVVMFGVMGRETGDDRGVYVVSGAFLLIGVPLQIWNLRKRERALLAMIEHEAPQLFRRLKNEKIT